MLLDVDDELCLFNLSTNCTSNRQMAKPPVYCRSERALNYLYYTCIKRNLLAICLYKSFTIIIIVYFHRDFSIVSNANWRDQQLFSCSSVMELLMQIFMVYIQSCIF